MYAVVTRRAGSLVVSADRLAKSKRLQIKLRRRCRDRDTPISLLLITALLGEGDDDSSLEISDELACARWATHSDAVAIRMNPV
jgi:hypothetical protein